MSNDLTREIIDLLSDGQPRTSRQIFDAIETTCDVGQVSKALYTLRAKTGQVQRLVPDAKGKMRYGIATLPADPEPEPEPLPWPVAEPAAEPPEDAGASPAAPDPAASAPLQQALDAGSLADEPEADELEIGGTMIQTHLILMAQSAVDALHCYADETDDPLLHVLLDAVSTSQHALDEYRDMHIQAV